jgi:betaine lipid synthase
MDFFSVNMYASCWLLTKVENLPPPTPKSSSISNRSSVELEELNI